MKHRIFFRAVVVLIGAFLVVALASPLRQKAASIARITLSLPKAIVDPSRVRTDSRGECTNIVFLHHSVGRELIRQGHLRERLSQAGFCVYDHDYNSPGLTRPDGIPAGYSYNVPDNNTDPGGLLRIFKQKAFDWPLYALSGLLQHEVIVVKSCFTAIRILSAEELEMQKAAYVQISGHMAQHPEKLFIIMTSPPANPAETDAGSASRAELIAGWLCSGEFGRGISNIRIFDLFGLLAEDNPDLTDFNMLRQQYRNGSDSHPNQAANEAIAPLLAEFIAGAAREFREQE